MINKVSIAMCTYNGARFIGEQLQSIAMQTRLPDELIVCDDASRDETVELVQRFAQGARFPVIVKRNDSNLGSTANFEQAIAAATGDVIFLADQDDVWRSDKIERITDAFSADGEIGMVFSDGSLIDEDGADLGRRLWEITFPPALRKSASPGTMFDILLWQNVVVGATMAFRSELREKFMPIPLDIPDLVHDGWIALVASVTGTVSFLDEPLTSYRRHGGQQLGLHFDEKAEARAKERYQKTIRAIDLDLRRLDVMKTMLATNPLFAGKVPRKSIATMLQEKDEPRSHLVARSRILSSPITKRVGAAWRELASGRYHKFSRGLRSAVSDVLWPDR